MTDRTTTEAGHPVYPAGPACDPSCPGEWSTYHDGYAWGYEKATAEARAALIDELVAAVEGLWDDWKTDAVTPTGLISRISVLGILEGARHGK